MSSAPRGRGRGRGLARPSSSRELSPPTTNSEAQPAADYAFEDGDGNLHESNVEDPSQASTSASTSHTGPARSASASTSGGPTLLRKNVYTGSSKMKFMPTMVKRKAQSVVQVKEEEIEPSLADPFGGRGSGRGRGRGRGRGEGKEDAGRGRGRNETQMYATGAFSYGPAQQERPKRSFGPSAGWASGGGGGGGSGGGGGGGGGTSSTAALVDSDPEDYGDADENGEGGGRKNKTVDLFDIGLENEMAPLVLPRDEKKWLEEEKLRKENEKAMAKLRLGPAGAAKLVKMDPYEEEENAAASLAGTPTASASATPAPSTATLQDAAPIEDDAAVLGADDVKITVKREDISKYFNLSPEESAHEQFYVFQFPRLFPQFVEPGTMPDIKPNPNDLVSSLLESKHKVKSAYHESEAEAWRDYIPGKWQGWGKNPGREGREILGATSNPSQPTATPLQAPEGRIGKLKVRRSGRTTLKLGGIEYEILPGAPSNFLQEIAVLEDEESKDDESAGKGMYVMGQASKKFVITPELGKLLQQDAIERAERARLQKEEAEIAAKKAKEEELEGKLSSQTAKAKRPVGKPAPRAKPGAAPPAGGARPKPAPKPSKA